MESFALFHLQLSTEGQTDAREMQRRSAADRLQKTDALHCALCTVQGLSPLCTVQDFSPLCTVQDFSPLCSVLQGTVNTFVQQSTVPFCNGLVGWDLARDQLRSFLTATGSPGSRLPAWQVASNQLPAWNQLPLSGLPGWIQL